MRGPSKFGSIVVAGVMTSAPIVVFTAAPSWAACSVFASTPVNGGYYVAGNGGKSGCATKNYIRVRLRWDRPLSPDPSLMTRQGQYTNVTLYVNSDCLLGTHDYYIDTDGDAGSATSDPRRRMTC